MINIYKSLLIGTGQIQERVRKHCLKAGCTEDEFGEVPAFWFNTETKQLSGKRDYLDISALQFYAAGDLPDSPPCDHSCEPQLVGAGFLKKLDFGHQSDSPKCFPILAARRWTGSAEEAIEALASLADSNDLMFLPFSLDAITVDGWGKLRMKLIKRIMTVRRIKAVRHLDPDDMPPLLRPCEMWDQHGIREFVHEGGRLILNTDNPTEAIRLLWNGNNPLSRHRIGYYCETQRSDKWQAAVTDRVRNNIAMIIPEQEVETSKWELGREGHPNNIETILAKEGLTKWEKMPATVLKNCFSKYYKSEFLDICKILDCWANECFVGDWGDGYFDADLLSRNAHIKLIPSVLWQAAELKTEERLENLDPHIVAEYACEAFKTLIQSDDWLSNIDLPKWLTRMTRESGWFSMSDGSPLRVVVRGDAPAEFKRLLRILIPPSRMAGLFVINFSTLDSPDVLR